MPRPMSLEERAAVGAARWGWVNKLELIRRIGPARLKQLGIDTVNFQEQQRIHKVRELYKCEMCGHTDVLGEGDTCYRCQSALNNEYVARLYPGQE